MGLDHRLTWDNAKPRTAAFDADGRGLNSSTPFHAAGDQGMRGARPESGGDHEYFEPDAVHSNGMRLIVHRGRRM